MGAWPQYSDGAVGVDASGRPHVHLNVLRYYLVCPAAPVCWVLITVALCRLTTITAQLLLVLAATFGGRHADAECAQWQAWFAFYVLRGSVADSNIGMAPQRPGGYIGSLNPGQFTGSMLKVGRIHL